MLSNMEPNHPFRSDIEVINSKIVAIVTTINATMNEAEAANMLRQACRDMEPSQESLVVPGRRLVREVACACRVESGKGKKEARVLILNDMLVVATLSRSFFSSKTSLQHRFSVSLAGLVLKEEGSDSLVVCVGDGGDGVNGITSGSASGNTSGSASGNTSGSTSGSGKTRNNATPTTSNTATPTNNTATPLFTLIWENPSEKDAFQTQVRQLQSLPS